MKRIALQIFIPLLLLAAAFAHAHWQSIGYEQEIQHLKSELAYAMTFTPLERDTILLPGDTVYREAVSSKVIRAELADLRRQHLVDENLIKTLGLRLKQLEAVQTTVTETEDSVKAEVNSHNKVFSYCDEWSHLQFRLQDSTFYYNIRDSLATVVHREYKHRFLWFRWGTKGYKVTLVNFNPRAHIRYNTYIKPE